MWITSSLNTAKGPTAIALGNFDGVHLGHRQVIRPIVGDRVLSERPGIYSCPTTIETNCSTDIAGYGGYSTWQPSPSLDGSAPEPSPPTPPNSPAGNTPCYATVVTFFPHPQEYFSGQPRRLLTPLEEKVDQLQRMGVDQLVLLPFNQTLANLTPQAFVESVLLHQLNAQHISVGADFRFGHQRSGTADLLRQLAADHGIPVTIVPLKLIHDDGRISSSSIRQALQSGDIDQVKQRLGRPYTLVGRVIKGQQLGRTLGFPTANLKLPAEKFMPRQGVYAVWVHGIPSEPMGVTLQPGVMNIGVRPTVSGQTQTCEVHLLDWSGDLYGQTLVVALVDFLRPEQKFSSLDQLKSQIQTDCDRAMQRLAVGNRPENRAS